MGESAFYYGGIRLKDDGHGWRPRTDRAGDHRQGGVTAQWGTQNPDSPNFFQALEVVTDVRPVTARTDLDARTTLAIDMAAHEQALREYSHGAVHPVAWVRDTARAADVTAGGAAGTLNLTLGAVGGGWVPAAGHYVLLRKASTGQGEVVPIISIPGAGQIRVTSTFATDATWDVLEVQVHYPEMLWLSMDPGSWPLGDPASDTWRGEVTYGFDGVAGPVYAAAYAPTPE